MALVTLQVLDGADRGRVFENVATPVTIGREEGNSVQLNDERISRFHLKIQEDEDKLVLTDLESTNGTKVNGESIQLWILRYGDVIALGRTLLLFGSRDEIAQRLAVLRGVGNRVRNRRRRAWVSCLDPPYSTEESGIASGIAAMARGSRASTHPTALKSQESPPSRVGLVPRPTLQH